MAFKIFKLGNLFLMICSSETVHGMYFVFCRKIPLGPQGKLVFFQAKPILTIKMFIKKRGRQRDRKRRGTVLKAVTRKVPGDILKPNTIETDF